jgi:hypothetical protein
MSVKERAIREKICTPNEEFDLCACMRRLAQAHSRAESIEDREGLLIYDILADNGCV